MKFGGQGIFDNAVFLVGTSARKLGFLRLYKTKELIQQNFVVFGTVYFDQIPSKRQTGLNIPQTRASARNKFWRSGFLWALAAAQGFRVWSIVVEYK